MDRGAAQDAAATLLWVLNNTGQGRDFEDYRDEIETLAEFMGVKKED